MSDPTIKPLEKTLTLGGQSLTVRPLKVRHIPAFSGVIGPLYAQIAQGEPDWFGLIASHGESLVEAVSLGLGLPHEQVGDLDLAELVEAVMALVEVNVDFFIQRLSPQISQASQVLAAIRGQMDSSASLLTDTATQRSSTIPSGKSARS